MAGKSAILAVRIVADASEAAKGTQDAADALGKVEGAAKNASGAVDSAERGMRDLGDAAGKAAGEAKSASSHLEDVGGASGRVTTGLRDMSDAIAMLGFPQLAAGMQIAATGFEAVDGAATLFEGTAGLVAKAQGVWAKTTGLVTKAMNLLKVSILTNPVFIIAAILIGIAAAFVLLYKRCEGFRKIVDAVFKAALKVIQAVWNWIKRNWPLLLAILTGPIGLAILFVTKNFDKISAFVGKVIDKVKDIFSKVFDYITAPFQRAMDWIREHVKLPELKLPFGIGGNAAATARVPGVATTAAPRAGGTSGGLVINFNGPIGDPHALVRQLRRLFADDAARLGVAR